MCPPKLCECSSKMKSRRSFLGGIFALLGFGLKAAIAAGLVYWTYDIGLWGDSEDTEDLYLDIRDMIVPAPTKRKKQKKLSELCEAEIELMCKRPPTRDESGECLKAPSAENAVFTLKDYWNRGVVYTFDVLTNFPTYISGGYLAIRNFALPEDSKCKKQPEKNKTDNANT